MERTPERLRRRRLGVVAGASAALVAGALAVAASSPAQAAACESVDYTVVSEWNGGHQANVSITAGTEAINGWTLEFELPEGVTVSSAWNADWSQSGTNLTASDVGWNGSIAAGQTREVFGMILSDGTVVEGAQEPIAYYLNGEACGDTSQPSDTPSDTPGDTPSETPTETDPPDPGEPGDCPAGAVCDGFEDQTGTTPGGDWTVGAENCTGTGTATVDSSIANSGAQSIRVDGGGTYCNHVFIGRDLPAGTEWFRLYMRHDTPQPQNHTTMIAMDDAADGGSDLRMGGQNGALQWNRESDDATLPAQSPTGVSLSQPLPVDTWTCVEFQIVGGNLSTWVDGALVEGLVVDGEPTQDVDQQWLSKAGWSPELTDLRLGWESYGADADTLWYDDVAFGSERIGC